MLCGERLLKLALVNSCPSINHSIKHFTINAKCTSILKQKTLLNSRYGPSQCERFNSEKAISSVKKEQVEGTSVVLIQEKRVQQDSRHCTAQNELCAGANPYVYFYVQKGHRVDAAHTLSHPNRPITRLHRCECS